MKVLNRIIESIDDENHIEEMANKILSEAKKQILELDKIPGKNDIYVDIKIDDLTVWFRSSLYNYTYTPSQKRIDINEVFELNIKDEFYKYDVDLFLNHVKMYLIHELTHYFDDKQTDGKIFNKYNKLDKTNKKSWKDYVGQTSEINANYTSVVNTIKNTINRHTTWDDFKDNFIYNFRDLGWDDLKDKTKKRLINRLYTRWENIKGN